VARETKIPIKSRDGTNVDLFGTDFPNRLAPAPAATLNALHQLLSSPAANPGMHGASPDTGRLGADKKLRLAGTTPIHGAATDFQTITPAQVTRISVSLSGAE
jgi:hypothetical protein